MLIFFLAKIGNTYWAHVLFGALFECLVHSSHLILISAIRVLLLLRYFWMGKWHCDRLKWFAQDPLAKVEIGWMWDWRPITLVLEPTHLAIKMCLLFPTRLLALLWPNPVMWKTAFLLQKYWCNWARTSSF